MAFSMHPEEIHLALPSETPVCGETALSPFERGTLMTDTVGKSSWWGRGGAGGLATPQVGRDGLEGVCPESKGGQAVKLKLEIHGTLEAFGKQDTAVGRRSTWLGNRAVGVQSPWCPHPVPYSA